ncbi:MAG: S1C family serine protease [Treponemataceae bacterium]|nr:MAG: S1C family serine protease [Treponemataceae bacterium]
MKSIFPRRAAVFASALLCFSCVTTDNNREQFESIRYTQEDVRLAEIGRIGTMIQDAPVKALWRALLLRDAAKKMANAPVIDEAEELLSRAGGAVADAYKKALNEKKYYEAYRLLSALEAARIPPVDRNTSAAMFALASKNIAALNTPSSRAAVPMSTSIKGTVTVWLDLGVRVERGMGFVNTGLGSGFFIDKSGYIITNHHVIQAKVDPKYRGRADLYIKLADDPDTRIPARVVGWDPLLDIALLKTEVSAPHIFPLGSSLDLDAGDRVFAIGSPVGLERTLTSGIVSATERKLLTVGSVMQIDAAVNSGNSGGPLIDTNGNVQAIVFAGLLQFEGLNFAIPVEYLTTDLPALFAGGKLEHAWLGAYGHTFKDPASGLAGVEAQYILPGGSISYTEIQSGDIITALNGKRLARLDDLQNELLKLPSDSIAVVSGVKRSGESFSYPVYLEPRPDHPAKEAYTRDSLAKSFVPTFGMELVSVSSANKRQYSVKKVIRGGIAEESGFSENDPVEILRVRLIESRNENERGYLQAELYTKNRKNGYLDAGLAIFAPLDNPYYF